MKTFVFKKYEFDAKNFVAKFFYVFDGGQEFCEEIRFAKPEESICHPELVSGSTEPKDDVDSGRSVRNEPHPAARGFQNDNAGDTAKIDEKLLDSALFLAHILIGTSYYKTFPTRDVKIESSKIDVWQADFFDKVFQEGLSQFAYENNLTRGNMAHFQPDFNAKETAHDYDGAGILALQSGGKDSLLVAEMLVENRDEFETLYFSSHGRNHPQILDDLDAKVLVTQRKVDHENLVQAAKKGALNGHVPVTYILQGLAVVQAILLGKNAILTAVAHEGEEPRDMIDDLPINHQWSKTWAAEQAFQTYVEKYISPQIQIGSPLRQYSELAVSELFVAKCWEKFGRKFSSCNLGNYMQGTDNSHLKWCGECAKCANSWLLFAPFVAEFELRAAFVAEQDLFLKPELFETFKGLLGIDDVPKPFECVGEVAELRKAYHLAQDRGDYKSLPFSVPKSNFDYHEKYAHNGNLVI
ncbi:hypothetical protein FWG95_03990 [Candidatus Saccharibacteria bacterium]|nr:hypothetical protein [Candidatus Saccharibacteria bacterium]